MSNRFFRQLAGVLANSPFLSRGRSLYAENAVNWNLPLSKLDKLRAGGWLILDDYSKGLFPPVFLDQQAAYQAEKDYRFSIPGVEAKMVSEITMAKPFWFGKGGRSYLEQFNRIASNLESLGVKPPAKLLELGCGGGWMAEFLATMGYNVCGTTLSLDDISDATRRIRSLEAKGLLPSLRYVAAPMESVHKEVGMGSFDAVFVYEALHHAFDWREAIRSSYACLKPGGWLLICNEPNILHTLISYRIAKLSNAHEIGFRKRELLNELRSSGFRRVVSVGPRLHFWFRQHWLLALR